MHGQLKKIRGVGVGVCLLIASCISAEIVQDSRIFAQPKIHARTPKRVPTKIIFDLGGVLFNVSRDKMGDVIKHEIGMGRLLGYILFGFNNPKKLGSRSFEILEHLFGKQMPEQGCTYTTGSQEPDGTRGYACSDDGRTPLPRVLCRWLAGLIGGAEIGKETRRLINEGAADGYSHSKRDLEILSDIVGLIFDPQIMADNTEVISEGARLLADSIATTGNHNIFVLSNFARDSFECLYNSSAGRAIFYVIPPENLIISGYIGYEDEDGTIHNIKPYKSIYDYLLNTYHLDPEDCVFIDDQLVNVLAARACGIRAIHLKDGNYAQVRAELRKLGIHLTKSTKGVYPACQGCTL